MLRAMSEPSDVNLDPAAAYAGVAELRAALARRDWPACRAVLDAAPAGGRTFLTRLAGEEKDLEGFLRPVLKRDPGDADAGALLGLHLIEVGWGIRTRARAKDVSREQFSAFHEWLRKAEQILIDAAAHNPAEPAVWVARLLTARGLELGLAETRRRYDRLRAIDPHNYAGQTQFLQTLCPKWCGSWEQLHAWSREEMLAAPPGSLQGGLIAEAHLEHWFDLEGAEWQAYSRDERVRAELYEAANRSIGHPEFRRGYGWVQVASTFAVLFSVLDDQRAAAAAFSTLGNLAAPFPWKYLSGDIATTVRQRRVRALAVAGGAR